MFPDLWGRIRETCGKLRLLYSAKDKNITLPVFMCEPVYIGTLVVCLPESSSMISVHIVGDEEFSTPDHRVCDNQLPARVCRGKKNTVVLNTDLHYVE